MKAFNFAIGVNQKGAPEFLGFAPKASDLLGLIASPPKGIAEVHCFHEPAAFRVRKAGWKPAEITSVVALSSPAQVSPEAVKEAEKAAHAAKQILPKHPYVPAPNPVKKLNK